MRVICNYLDDIYYLRSLLTRTESFRVIREADYIKEPKETGYRSLHLIVEVPIVISEGTLKRTGRCRTSIRASRRSTRTESYIKKEAAVPPLFCPCRFLQK